MDCRVPVIKFLGGCFEKQYSALLKSPLYSRFYVGHLVSTGVVYEFTSIDSSNNTNRRAERIEPKY